MNRTLLITIALAGLAGGALGWGWLTPKPGDRGTTAGPGLGSGPGSPGEGGATGATRAAGAGRREFPLLPADVTSIREAPSLAVAPGGAILLAWASETGPDERTVMLARSDDGGASFGDPERWRVVPTYTWTVEHGGRPMTHSTHVLPRLAAGGGAVVLGWVEAEPGGPDAAFLAARSDDGGRTFGPPVSLTSADAPRPGFTALAVGEGGALLASWIDNRNGPQQPFFRRTFPSGDPDGPDRLVFAGPEGLGICPCCDTAVIEADDGGAIVAFRNGDGGHRDIWVARSDAEGDFGPPIPVAPDRAWTFRGCPHDGPSLARSGDRLLVAWMDGSSGTERVAIAEADLRSLSFSAARELDPRTPGAQGHPRLAVGPDGAVHAAWEATLDDEEGGRAIRYARLDGPAPPEFLDPRPGAYQALPALAIGPDGTALVAWNELDEDGKRVVVVRRRPGPGGAEVAGR